MTKKINNNCFEYVDLCLPSGTLWATCNVGADKPSDYGLYFQWGDTKGYSKEQVGKYKEFNWGDYKFSKNRSGSNFSKYATTGEILKLKDDAAHINMGGDWHIPTPSQFKELLDNTTSAWTTLYGVNGRMFTSIKDKSKCIFIPAVGNAYNNRLYGSGSYGYVWSSALYRTDVYNGQYLFLNSEGTDLNGNGRNFGFSIRGVIG